jgi:hypothetical protein
MSAIVKGLKRVMAGEYSRELSDKVFRAKCRVARLGYRVGGSAGYGLRRMVLDKDGRERGILEHGQNKFVTTDRVVLVPGPAKERAVLRWMFRQVAYHGNTPILIARALNRRGVPSIGGTPWTQQRVQDILNNEKYVGTLVFGKTSVKLRTPRVNTPRDQWVRTERAFEPAVEPKLFYAAQAVMSGWASRITSEAALDALRGALERHGRLSQRLIRPMKGMPCPEFYRRRFGGLPKVYELVGYRPHRDLGFTKGYAQRFCRLAALRQEVIGLLQERGAAVRRESRAILVVDGRLRVAVMLARRLDRPWIKPCWQTQLQYVTPRPDWVLVACPAEDGNAIEEYDLVGGGLRYITINAKYRKGERHTLPDLDVALDMLDVLRGARPSVTSPDSRVVQ